MYTVTYETLDPEAAELADETGRWYHTPVGIVLLTLFVLGPLSLPLVWRSPVLSERGRWIGTALIVTYTIVLVWQTWVAVQLVLRQFPAS